MRVHVIGDAHGKMMGYEKVLHGLPDGEDTFQLGDMGHGFKEIPVMHKRHHHIRGNHDDPARALAHPNYAGEYGFLPDLDAFFFGGAWSIDWKYRVRGLSWWQDEEQSQEAMYSALDLYKECEPRVVLSHECPSSATAVLLKGLMGDYFYEKAQCADSRTAQFLQSLLEVHEPELWFFGHYHVDKEFKVEGFKTEFRCVAELSVASFETSSPQGI